MKVTNILKKSLNYFKIPELKVRCYPPESTTKTDQVTSTEDSFTTTTTKSMSHNHMTISATKSTIEREKENIIYKGNYNLLIHIRNSKRSLIYKYINV